MNDKTFKEKYNYIRKFNSRLVCIDESVIDAIDRQIIMDEHHVNTYRFIITVFLASLCVSTLPLISHELDYIISPLIIYIKSLKINTETYFNVIEPSLFIASSALLFYLLIFPSIAKHFKFILKSDFGAINMRNFVYLLSCLFSIYFFIGVCMISMHYHLKYSWINNFIYGYIAIPVFVISIVFIFSALFLISTFIFKKQLSQKHINTNKKIVIILLIMDVLNDINSEENIEFISRHKQMNIVDNLIEVGSLIRSFPFDLSYKIPNEKMIDQFNNNANEIDRIISVIGTGSRQEINKIEDSLIDYINIILTDNLENLPQSKAIFTSVAETKKVKLYHYAFLMIYLTLPILIVIGTHYIFKVKFDDYTQSLLRVLYVLWALVGIFSNPLILDSENKDLIKDMLKSLLGK